MSLALPLALLVGLLVAGPIVAHVVRRSETPTHELPTIRLLRKAVAQTQRRRRLDDAGLFALRAAFVLLATLAAAAPFVRVPLELGNGRACAIAVVVDGSRSMLARRAATPLVELARERAENALESLPEGSERTLVFATDPPTILADRTLDARTAAGATSRITSERSVYGDVLLESIRLAIRRLHTSSFAVRRLVVYSDFARHVDLSQLEIPEGIDVELVRLEPSSHANAAVEVDGIRADPADRRQRIVRAYARGYDAEGDATLTLVAEGRTLAEARTAVAEAPETLELHATVGDRTPVARLSADFDDALPEDDALELLLRTPSETRVLFVDGEPSTHRYDDEVGLAARALELVPEDERRFEPTRVDLGAVDDAMLDRHDVVVLANVDALPPALAASLTRRVQAGLGLLVAPGDRTDGRALSQALAAILPARIGVYARCDERRGVVLRDAPTALVVSGLDRVLYRGCSDVDAVLGRSRTALVREDGSALLVLGETGRGRVAVLGSPLDPEGSDLPLRPGFMPLLASLLTHLDGSASASNDRVRVGSRPTLGEPGLRVRAPSGAVLEADAQGRVGPVAELGVHVVLRDGREDDDASFTVVAPGSESELRPAALPDVRTRRGGRRSTASTLERDVSAPVFALLGLVLVAEGVLRERQRGRRAASTTRATPP